MERNIEGERLAFKHAARLCKEYRRTNEILIKVITAETIALAAAIVWMMTK